MSLKVTYGPFKFKDTCTFGLKSDFMKTLYLFKYDLSMISKVIEGHISPF